LQTKKNCISLFEFHHRSVQPPVTQAIKARCLRLFGHIVRSDSDEDVHVPSTPALTTRRRTGDDHVVVLDKRGGGLSSRTSNDRIWGRCGLRDTELLIVFLATNRETATPQLGRAISRWWWWIFWRIQY